MSDADTTARFPRPATRRPVLRPVQRPVQRPVWDLFIRLFHWALVGSIGVAAITGFLMSPQWIPVHIVAASLAVVLVVVRIVWGFFGGSYARFSGFIPGPRRLIAYSRDLLAGREAHYVGHNPLGGAMVVALILAVLTAGLTGWAFLGGSAKLGPLAFVVPFEATAWIKEIHEVVAFAILGLVAAHVAGVVFTGKREGKNLVAAMVTGEKPVGPDDITPPERPARRAAALALALAVLAVLAVGIAAPVVLTPPGAPVAEIDPVVQSECTDCHMLYHPSLLPARDWEHITATLEDHYGEDAWLDEETTAHIRDWLTAHAAETADTRAAHVFRLDPEAGITRISDTPFWKERHAFIPEAAFRSPEVGSRDNCAACHADAEAGWFSPLNAEIED